MKKYLLAMGLLAGLLAAAFIGTAGTAHAQGTSMAFWGNVTIDGAPARVGTIIRAYYSTSTLAGEATVQETGVYGYADPAKQQLVVAEGSGPITFTFQEDPNDRGGETGGLASQVYSSFESGSLKNVGLAFTLPAPPQTPSQISRTSDGEVLGASTTGQTETIDLLSNLLIQLKSLQKQLITKQFKDTSCPFTFTQNLSQGMTNAAVKNLQTALNFSALTEVAATGTGSAGNESTYFGMATKSAVINFQNIFSDEILIPAGLTAGNGYVGAATRAQLNLLCGH